MERSVDGLRPGNQRLWRAGEAVLGEAFTIRLY